jgi:preprotein translocase subunit SecD
MARKSRRRSPAESDAPAMMSLGTPGRREPTQLNAYPFWKYLLVLAIVALGALYAAPNLYQPDFAVQLSARSEEGASDERALRYVLGLATDALAEAGIEPLAVEEGEGGATLRFASNEVQLRARDAVDFAITEGGLSADYTVALDLASTTPSWLEDLGGERMSLGLDLSGGVHFLLQVDMASAAETRLRSFETEIRDAFREARFRGNERTMGIDVATSSLTVRFRSEDARDEGRTLLLDRLVEFDVTGVTDEGRPALRFVLRSDVVREIEDYAITQNLQSLRNRVNELGVSEPLIQRLGRDRIVVDLPGVQDPARAREILGKVANLEFRLEARADAPRSEVESFPYEGGSAELERDIIVTGERVNNAQVGFDPETALPQVNINLDGPGGSLMAAATGPNVGRRMGILYKEKETRQRIVEAGGERTIEIYRVDVERVISLATIQSTLGNRFRITGLSQREASDLSLLLRAGALAAPVYIVEERTVGASLGEANIEAGFLSVAVGFALVMAFMLVYYRLFGLAANLALAANLVLITAVMSLLGATLTLPGIAGIVLTVVMAVDANVLIFARIREELATRSPQQAISAGFDRAFVTILDANVTTFLVAIILYAIGSGPVKGFAITLAIGIVTSMFTAIMGTRALVNLIYGGRSVSRLAI